MENEQKPRPFLEYQSRVSGYQREGEKYRGAISCEYRSADAIEHFQFLCDDLRDTREEALEDVRDLFYKLETTSPPTVALNAQIYSLPTDDEHRRAVRWLDENEHVALHFLREFPGARLITTGLLGGSTHPGI